MNQIVVFLFLFLTGFASAQTLPSARAVNWTLAGLRDTTTLNFIEIDMQSYGAVGNGTVPNDSVLNHVLSTFSGSGLRINFPAGTFLFNNTIVLDSNIVIKGAGAEHTIFRMDLGGSGHAFAINGNIQMSDSSSIVQSVFKDSNHIFVANPSIFSPGDWVRIIQNDTDLVTSVWAEKTVGQLVKIQAIENGKLILATPMRMDFDISRSPFLVKFIPAKNVGIECLKIHRMDDTAPQQSSNIHFNYAVNCWVMGIESENCTFSHIGAYFSSNLNCSKSYFHHAFGYGGDGRAYGIMLQSTTNECRFENNVFEHLRHAMILQSGANGNVFAYNYSLDPFWESTPNNSAGDMVLHGNFPYANLFEQNICQNIVIDDSHGPNGPNNTFFRNRAEGFGIFFSAANSPDQNILGNEITNLNFPYNLVNYTIQGTGHFLYGNNNKGTLVPSGTNILPDSSYAYVQRPNFLPISNWSGIGTPNSMQSQSIPAFDRLADGLVMANACSMSELGLPEIQFSAGFISIFPNPFLDVLTIQSSQKINQVLVTDELGRIVALSLVDKLSTQLNTADWPKGIYLLTFSLEKGAKQMKRLVK